MTNTEVKAIRNSGLKIVFVLLVQIFTHTYVLYHIHFASNSPSISQM